MENFINLNSLECSNKKLSLYKREEDLIFDDLKDRFNKINYGYQTKHTSSLISLESELFKKFKVISQAHQNNMTIMNKVMTGYRETQNKVSEILNNIDTN